MIQLFRDITNPSAMGAGPQPATGPNSFQPGQPMTQQLNVDQLPIVNQPVTHPLTINQAQPTTTFANPQLASQLSSPNMGTFTPPPNTPPIPPSSTPPKSNSKTSVNNQSFFDPSVTQEDILQGRVPVAHLDLTQDKKGNYSDPSVARIASTNPNLLRAIKDKQDMDYQDLLNTAQQNTKLNNNRQIDPMAVQLLWNQSISPFLNNVMNTAHQQTDTYSNLMNQFLGDKSLPEAYRGMMKAQVPAQVADMNNLVNAAALQTTTAPSNNSFLSWLQQDAMTRQLSQAYLIAQARIGLQNQLGGNGSNVLGVTTP